MTTYNEYDVLRREERKQKAKQAEQHLGDPFDQFPWLSDDGHRYRHRASIIGRAAWAPRARCDQNVGNYPESQYGRPREYDR